MSLCPTICKVNSFFILILSSQKIEFTLVILDCYMEKRNIDPGQNDVGNVGNVTSATECQMKCRVAKFCAAFVYNTVSKKCYFKSRFMNQVEIVKDDNSVSGEAYCRK